MKRFLCALVVACLAVANAVDAGPLKLRMKGHNPAATPPSVQITMGAKTLLDNGGVSVVETPSSAVSGGSFLVDSSTLFVPANSGGGTPGTIWTPPSSPANVTGQSGTNYLVNIPANTAHVLTWTEGGTLWENSTASKGLARGDTIAFRDSVTNPTGALWYWVPGANGAQTGSGRITITSEHPDTGTDANGNLKRGGGALFGMIYTDPAVTGSQMFYDWADVTFYVNVASPSGDRFYTYSGSGGSGSVGGVGYYRVRFENGPAVSDPDGHFGVFPRGDAVIQDSFFKNIGLNIQINQHAYPGTSNFSGNVFDSALGDIMDFNDSGLTVDRNFAFGMIGCCGEHQDFLQLQSNCPGGAGTAPCPGSGYSVTVGPFRKNIFTNDINELTNAFFYINDFYDPGYSSYAAPITNNITSMGNVYGIQLQRPDAPVVRYNTILNDPLLTRAVSDTSINIPQAGRNGATMDHNITNALSAGAQPGVVVTTPNTLLPTAGKSNAQMLTIYQTVWPNYPSSKSNANWKTYAGNLFIFTPANRLASLSPPGAVNDSDGTVNGALFPACAPATTGAWNDGSVWNCADSGWLAAHPPATVSNWFLLVLAWRRRRPANDNVADAERKAA